VTLDGSYDRTAARLIDQWRDLMEPDRAAVINALWYSERQGSMADAAAMRIAIELLESLGYKS
jgi:hypothetical protein